MGLLAAVAGGRLMRPLVMTAVVVLAAAAVVMGAYLKGRADGVASERLARMTEEQLVARTREAVSQATAEAIAGIEVRHVTIQKQVEREIREKPVYRDCVHSPDGLRWINDALRGAGSAGDRGLPTADATR